MVDWVPLNFVIMSRWQNWIIILLMLIIAGIGVDLLASLTLKQPMTTPAN